MHIKSLKAKLLLLLICIVVISNVILGFLAYTMSKGSLSESVELNITTISEKIAKQVYQTNEREFHMLDALAHMSVLRDPDIPAAEKTQIIFDATKTDSHYENIAFYGADGISITGDGARVDFSDREYFKRAMAGEHFVSDPAISPVNNKLLMFYSAPIYNLENTQIIGVLCAVFHGTRFPRCATKSRLEKEAIRSSSI